LGFEWIFAGNTENVGRMNSAKYRNILEYVKSQKYPAGFSKNEKLVLRKFCKNFEYYCKKRRRKNLEL